MKKNHKVYDEYNTDLEISDSSPLYKPWNEKWLNYLKNLNGISENCKLKSNSKNIVLGEGNIDSPIMLIGEAPGEIEDKVGRPFKGESGELLDKMLIAINIKRQNIYTSYAINFRPPEDRKPTSPEIKRYSNFLKEHISIIDPKIIILMGSTAMEAVTGINEKISSERGKWKEIILNNNTYPLTKKLLTRHILLKII